MDEACLIFQPAETQSILLLFPLQQVVNLSQRHHIRQVVRYTGQTEIFLWQFAAKNLRYLVVPHYILAYIKTVFTADYRHKDVVNVLIILKPET